MMHPKIQRRRGAVLSEQLGQLDQDIQAVCASLAHRVRLAGSLCIGDDAADSLEKQFRTSVDCVLKIPAITEEGRTARRALLQKLIELEAYLESLFQTTWVKSDIESTHGYELDKCSQNLDLIKTREYY
ncbi:hypothetical protein [Pleomorphomonas sp. PLEO]|uniref:hypothetical protein n=1 Tax=Pleomorphomonas sp. PLEO TaxID=3239306 RepID=UPI00351E6E55